MRLFIAIQLSETMRDALCRIQDEYVRRGVHGNFTRRENLHLTLAFIGEYPDPERILEVIDGISWRPFDLRLNGMGAFGDLWWVGLERSEPLEACVKALRHALADAGIPFDRKRFTPHITLVRSAEGKGRAIAGTAIDRVGMTVERISLMRSDRGKSGMIYTEIT